MKELLLNDPSKFLLDIRNNKIHWVDKALSPDQEPTGIPAGRESRRRDHDFSPGPGPGQFVSLAGILAGIFSKK